MRVGVLLLACTVGVVHPAFGQDATASDPAGIMVGLDRSQWLEPPQARGSERATLVRFAEEITTLEFLTAPVGIEPRLDLTMVVGDQLPTVASNPDKTRHLVIALAGAGLAVASFPVIANSNCRLGEYCTRLQIGTYMLATGAVLAGYYLWKAYR